MSVESEIDLLFDAWKAAVTAKDVERVAALTTEDCEFWANSAPPLSGRDRLRATLAAFYATYDHRQEFERLELITADDVAFVRGIEHNFLHPTAGGPEVRRVQRAFMVIRKGHDGRWRFARGMTNLPPPEPSATVADAPA
jgi:uncharacterized protein (TIGR02246 family)